MIGGGGGGGIMTDSSQTFLPMSNWVKVSLPFNVIWENNSVALQHVSHHT